MNSKEIEFLPSRILSLPLSNEKYLKQFQFLAELLRSMKFLAQLTLHFSDSI